jgi:hypothetical protein
VAEAEAADFPEGVAVVEAEEAGKFATPPGAFFIYFVRLFTSDLNNNSEQKNIMTNLNPLTLAKAYLLAELSRIFSSDAAQPELKAGLDRLTEKETWRMLEAMSLAYRLNPLFWFLSDPSYVWRKESVEVAHVTLTNMNPRIDAVTYSESVHHDPLVFRDYLLKYFKEHPADDPLGLEQFRPHGKPIRYPEVFIHEIDGQLRLLDGSNRVVACALQGITHIQAYICIKNSADTTAGKPMVGDSTIYSLQKRYERSNDETDKAAIITVVKKLMRENSDGPTSVENYWIDHVKDEKGKQIGENLLRS